MRTFFTIIAACIFTASIAQVHHIYYKDTLFYRLDSCHVPDHNFPQPCYREKPTALLRDGTYIVHSRHFENDPTMIEKYMVIKNGKPEGRQIYNLSFNATTKKPDHIIEEVYNGGTIQSRIVTNGDSASVHSISYTYDFTSCETVYMHPDNDVLQPPTIISYPDSIISYWNSKQRKSSGYYLHCRKSGTWKTWDKNGKLMSIAYYKNGKESGNWLYWTHGDEIFKQQLIQVDEYRHGQLKKSKQLKSDYGKRSVIETSYKHKGGKRIRTTDLYENTLTIAAVSRNGTSTRKVKKLKKDISNWEYTLLSSGKLSVKKIYNFKN